MPRPDPCDQCHAFRVTAADAWKQHHERQIELAAERRENAGLRAKIAQLEQCVVILMGTSDPRVRRTIPVH